MTLPALFVSEIPGQPLPGWEALLGPQERSRYLAATAPKRKLQFLATRVLLRRALERELGFPAAGFEITAEAGQGPRLLNLKRPLFASLSHTDGACAVLLSETPCGVDIEDASRLREFPDLAKNAFNGDELAIFEKNPVPENFYKLWTIKEAIYKAGQPCAWLGQLSFKQYRVCAALPLTGLQNLVIW